MEVLKSLKYSFYVILHPFNGFWNLKHEKKGNVKAAVSILLLLTITYVVRRQLTGFLFNRTDPTKLNILLEFMSIMVPFLLWCIANWSLTTLMDGKGSFKDIVIATAFALTPLIIIYIPLIILSNFITTDEGSFYYFFSSLAIVWAAVLLLIGTMTVHQYTLFKTVGASILIVVGMGIIIFLGLLFFNLLQEMIDYGYSIFIEITRR